MKDYSRQASDYLSLVASAACLQPLSLRPRRSDTSSYAWQVDARIQPTITISRRWLAYAPYMSAVFFLVTAQKQPHQRARQLAFGLIMST